MPGGALSYGQAINFFAIAPVRALPEMQVKGAHGRAARLPTGRRENRALQELAGRPVTGYHVFLNLFIMLLIHLPILYYGFSGERDAELPGPSAAPWAALTFLAIGAVAWGGRREAAAKPVEGTEK